MAPPTTHHLLHTVEIVSLSFIWIIIKLSLNTYFIMHGVITSFNLYVENNLSEVIKSKDFKNHPSQKMVDFVCCIVL